MADMFDYLKAVSDGREVPEGIVAELKGAIDSLHQVANQMLERCDANTLWIIGNSEVTSVTLHASGHLTYASGPKNIDVMNADAEEEKIIKASAAFLLKTYGFTFDWIEFTFDKKSFFIGAVDGMESTKTKNRLSKHLKEAFPDDMIKLYNA